ncbi:hypothetical protein Sjap_003727 [Stephania japonica]|uniref:Uncharacterized protein n=1 Tax=Stephania japonica TaxID=461633 RepID=A0AAP0PTV8_9MAGN
MTMNEFLKRMKDISDSLSTAGSPIPVSELISCILTGLDNEYLPISSILEQKDELTWQELQSTLLGFEAKLNHLQTMIGVNSLSLNSPNQVNSAEVKQGGSQPWNNSKQNVGYGETIIPEEKVVGTIVVEVVLDIQITIGLLIKFAVK